MSEISHSETLVSEFKAPLFAMFNLKNGKKEIGNCKTGINLSFQNKIFKIS